MDESVIEWTFTNGDVKDLPKFERAKVNPKGVLGFGYDTNNKGEKRIFAILNDGSVVYDIKNVREHEDDPNMVIIRTKCINAKLVPND